MGTTGRKCGECWQVREPDSFLSDALRARCMVCRLDESSRNDPAAVRAKNLWTKYRITLADYQAMAAEQDHCCAICRKHQDDLPERRAGRPRADGAPPADNFRLAVDHCHATGRVRGLLCVPCNAALGIFKDSPEVLRTAIEYLQREPTFQPSVQPLFAA
ncbi:endonuclease VII domain-containing protein [Micromonospora sp. NPDC007208]|uniref:endonuclease VII domain-containing protein n=1 Tax=Micromonospora sp. NPDC007208 TaxID=3364236 RepID=UPI0036A5DFD4